VVVDADRLQAGAWDDGSDQSLQMHSTGMHITGRSGVQASCGTIHSTAGNHAMKQTLWGSTLFQTLE
jgi:hypothetical protein